MPTAPDDQFAEYLASSEKSARLQALAVLFASHTAQGWSRKEALEKCRADLALIESD